MHADEEDGRPGGIGQLLGRQVDDLVAPPDERRGRVVERPLPDLADTVEELDVDRQLAPDVVCLPEAIAEIRLEAVEHFADRLRELHGDVPAQDLHVELLAGRAACADEPRDQGIGQVLVDDREHIADHRPGRMAREDAEDVGLTCVGRRSDPGQKRVREGVGHVAALLERGQRHARGPSVVFVGER